jgi:hypothetical protein
VSEIVEVKGYEWRWAATTYDAQRGVAIKTCPKAEDPTFERILVLYRIEMYRSENSGGMRAVLVLPNEIPIGETLY